MITILLSLLLAMQMMCCNNTYTNPAPHSLSPQPQQLWWGMLDPELSAWFARIPGQEDPDEAVFRWDWSWRGLLAALFQKPIIEEDPAHAPSV